MPPPSPQWAYCFSMAGRSALKVDWFQRSDPLTVHTCNFITRHSLQRFLFVYIVLVCVTFLVLMLYELVSLSLIQYMCGVIESAHRGVF